MSHPLLAKMHDVLLKIKNAFKETPYKEKTNGIIRTIEQVYVKTANGTFESSASEGTNDDENVLYSLRQKPEPEKKGTGYKVFVLGKDGKLYPPMVANPNGAATPVGVWLDADAAPVAGESKTGRPQVKQGGKGTQGGSGKLAYRPGWHLGVIPYAIQFNRKDAEGNKVKKSDFIRKKGLTQHTYGMVYNTNYKDEHWDVIGGLNLQQFRGNHWGYLTYIANQDAEKKFFGSNGKYKYYDSDAHKYDYSAFVKASYRFADYWNAFADLQYRRVEYKTDGINDKFIAQADGSYKNQELNINEKYNFFNPKAGISFNKDGHKAYASVAYSNREPERNNFTDNFNYPFPKEEKLLDVEFGYQYQGDNWHAGANFYYMDYDNQLAQTGQLSDIGEALTTNIKDSYRMGVELTAGWAPLSWLSVEGNAALSKNKIKDFDEYVSNWEDDKKPGVVHYDNSTLSYSPSAILNGFIDIHYAGFSATWHTNFVSRQYITNTEDRDFSLPCYSQSDLSLNYSAKLAKALGIKEVSFGVDINNIFNRHYAASAFTWGNAIGYGYTLDKRFKQIAYIPMADTTWMTHLTLKF